MHTDLSAVPRLQSLSCQVTPGAAPRVSRWTPVLADGSSHQSLWDARPFQGSNLSLSITSALHRGAPTLSWLGHRREEPAVCAAAVLEAF